MAKPNSSVLAEHAFAIKETVPFYERFGFAAYDHDVGMYRVIRK